MTRSWLTTTNNVLLAVSIGALLVQGAAAVGSPGQRRANTSGGGCSPFGTWAFEGFDVMVTACCKQVNPIRQMFNRINACGPHTQPAVSAPDIFAGAIGKPSDCPDSNVDAVYTAALYVSEVVNSTVFSCVTALFNNPGQGAL